MIKHIQFHVEPKKSAVKWFWFVVSNLSLQPTNHKYWCSLELITWRETNTTKYSSKYSTQEALLGAESWVSPFLGGPLPSTGYFMLNIKLQKRSVLYMYILLA